MVDMTRKVTFIHYYFSSVTMFSLFAITTFLYFFIPIVSSFSVASISIQGPILQNGGKTSTSTMMRTTMKIVGQTTQISRTIRSQLRMGLFDFFKSREGDFVKLEETSTFGPGPVIILYNVPDGILDEEIRDMIDDGITSSRAGEVKFARLCTSDLDSMGEKTVQDVLEEALANKLVRSSQSSSPAPASISGSMQPYVPILYFSGIASSEMMNTYNIIGKEIYEESGGMANVACAKSVEPAMNKSFRQVVEEISGDHTDALQSSVD